MILSLRYIEHTHTNRYVATHTNESHLYEKELIIAKINGRVILIDRLAGWKQMLT